MKRNLLYEIVNALGRVRPHYLFISAVVFSVAASEIISAPMGFILTGTVPFDYIITTAVVSFMVSSIVVLFLVYLIKLTFEMGEAVKSEKELARLFLDMAGVMLVAIGRDRRVSIINKKGCEVLGYSEREIVGKDWFESFIPVRLRGEMEQFFDSLMKGDVEPFEHYKKPVIAKGCVERLMSWHNTVVRDKEGAVVAILSSGTLCGHDDNFTQKLSKNIWKQ